MKSTWQDASAEENCPSFFGSKPPAAPEVRHHCREANNHAVLRKWSTGMSLQNDVHISYVEECFHAVFSCRRQSNGSREIETLA